MTVTFILTLIPTITVTVALTFSRAYPYRNPNQTGVRDRLAEHEDISTEAVEQV